MANLTQAVARVGSEALNSLPEGLYIPPDALQVFLETFEGPLDLLLYLIHRQNLDILNIPVAQITAQYMQYIELMQHLNLELAADYLLMAAILTEIKARLLLPSVPTAAEEEEDPRAELLRRLQEYQQIKQAAEQLDLLPRLERDVFLAQLTSTIEHVRPLPQADLSELLTAFKELLARSALSAHHQIQRESLSVCERMTQILTRLSSDSFSPLHTLFTLTEGRLGLVVTFIAMLELLKQAMIEVVQAEPFAPIYLRRC
jgi:segregation and condensation protein A